MLEARARAQLSSSTIVQAGNARACEPPRRIGSFAIATARPVRLCGNVVHGLGTTSHLTALTMTQAAIDELIRGLNEDLRGEFQAVIMYRLFASMVQGPSRQELRAFFASEVPEELAHAQLLADKISAMGGIPASEPTPVKVVGDAKEMLETALAAEIETIERYVARRRQAEDAGEFGLAVQFDDIIADETNHRDELRQMLARWP